MGFVSLMCWKCDYVFADADKTHPYRYASVPLAYTSEGASGGFGCRSHKMLPLSKTLFCDDSSYTTTSVEGAKYILYRIGMFAAAYTTRAAAAAAASRAALLNAAM